MAWLLNAAVPPFDDVRVRQAMALAAPIKEIFLHCLPRQALGHPLVRLCAGELHGCARAVALR